MIKLTNRNVGNKQRKATTDRAKRLWKHYNGTPGTETKGSVTMHDKRVAMKT